ncbi:hypothetical protein FNV43_RR20306 [Rhamnella rubrinervis]|uniref:Uncharacterized protein n=1 Tax=Rhamnella rubrinervis TaxID=2594499 RepID=A0A8K0DZG2_9ROSA|nr:hypothetical protein FNV43_RR20306 [Rhamnella rubrinervis]
MGPLAAIGAALVVKLHFRSWLQCRARSWSYGKLEHSSIIWLVLSAGEALFFGGVYVEFCSPQAVKFLPSTTVNAKLRKSVKAFGEQVCAGQRTSSSSRLMGFGLFVNSSVEYCVPCLELSRRYIYAWPYLVHQDEGLKPNRRFKASHKWLFGLVSEIRGKYPAFTTGELSFWNPPDSYHIELRNC